MSHPEGVTIIGGNFNIGKYVSCGCFLAEDTLVTGTENGGIYFWDLNDPDNFDDRYFPAHDGTVSMIKHDTASNCLFTSGWDGAIRQWSLEDSYGNAEDEPRVLSHEEAIEFFETPRGFESESLIAEFHNSEHAIEIDGLDNHYGINDFEILPNGQGIRFCDPTSVNELNPDLSYRRRLATGMGRLFHLVSWENGQKYCVTSGGPKGGAHFFDTKSSDRFAFVHRMHAVGLAYVESKKLMVVGNSFNDFDAYISSVIKGREASPGGWISVVDLNQPCEFSGMEVSDSPKSFKDAYSPWRAHDSQCFTIRAMNDSWIVSTGPDGHIRIWNIDLNDWVAELECGYADVHDVAFSPSGNLIAAFCDDGHDTGYCVVFDLEKIGIES